MPLCVRQNKTKRYKIANFDFMNNSSDSNYLILILLSVNFGRHYLFIYHKSWKLFDCDIIV